MRGLLGVLLLLIPLLGCTDRPTEVAQMKDQSSERLRNWEYKQLITIERAKTPLKDILEELEHQSGIKVEKHLDEETATLKVKDVPFWKAVAEISIASGVPFSAGVSEPFVKFSKLSSRPIYTRYQIIGPFHLGAYWSPDGWKIDGKAVPIILIEASSLATEGEAAGRGIKNVVLDGPDQKALTLERVEIAGQSSLGRTSWIVPQEMVGKKVNLRGGMECDVYLNPQKVVLSAKADNSAEFKHFGGIKVSVTKITEQAVEYLVDWESGLEGQNLKDFKNLIARSKQKALGQKELEETADWVLSKSEKMRMLHLVEAKLVDSAGKAIPSAGSFFDESDHIRGVVYLKKAQEPKELEVWLAEKKRVNAVFEFSNIFGK
jgi:hypothetical protein